MFIIVTTYSGADFLSSSNFKLSFSPSLAYVWPFFRVQFHSLPYSFVTLCVSHFKILPGWSRLLKHVSGAHFNDYVDDQVFIVMLQKESFSCSFKYLF